MSTELVPTNEYQRLCSLVSTATVNAEVPVVDAESYRAAATKRLAVKQAVREVEDTRKSLTSQLDEKKKQIMSFFKVSFGDALDNAERLLTTSILQYDEARRREKEKQQREMEARLGAQQKAEAEAAALAALKQGKERVAVAILEAAENAPVAVPQLAEPKPIPGTGVSYRDVWKFEIKDAKAIPATFLMPDEKAIGAYVRAQKGNAAIPGVEVWCEKQPIQRA